MKKLQDELPQWNKEDLNAVIEMSGDDDGLLSACLLSFITGYPIRDFTDFDEGRYSLLPRDKRERISVDLARTKGKGIDNHFMTFSEETRLNKEMINVNNQREIPFDDYLKKYSMSTLILIYAVYKDRISLPESEKLKMMILTIDSAYKGYYKYKKNFIENLDYIGLKDELLPVLEGHTKQEFEALSRQIKEQCPQNFYLNKETGRLEFSSDRETQERAERYLERLSKGLGFTIALPTEQFELVEILSNAGKRRIAKSGDIDISHYHMVYCYAITNRGNFKSSYSRRILGALPDFLIDT
ncbi:hypothetical protein H7992_14170 [Sporosarcina sp. resist]|uniref:hypothetical protein n=1 Tax=Sporosarcina sp. resist TaxID=2762563 RepID=UPI00164DAAD8|nr:hypothetical protein [Sporosarcina sp. resist]QNK86405.1 hypothetical protein H7992_14170 [Sporosarcina sp. resist]